MKEEYAFDFDEILKGFRNGIKLTGKGAFPNENSLLKLLYLGIQKNGLELVFDPVPAGHFL